MRPGVAAAEAVLIAPLLLVCIWLIFFFGGAMVHKQQVIKAARAGTWAHVRVFTDRGHFHPPYDPTETTPDPRQFYVWAGETGHDYRVTTLYYLRDSVEPVVGPDESEPAGGVSRLSGALGASQQGRSAQAYFSAIPGSFGTETWSVSATYDTQMVRWIGNNVNRTVQSRYRMDMSTWQDFDYRAGLNLLPATTAEDAMVLDAIGRVQALQLLPQGVPTLLTPLSVVR